MKGKSKKLKVAAIAAAMLVPGAVLAQSNIYVNVNGDAVAFPGVGPQQVNGRVLVPLRGVMEKLGAYVSYDAPTKTVTATRSGTDLRLRLGDRNAFVNGRNVQLDVPAMEVRGSTMVPLRFVGEALGADVRWNAATYTVDITTMAGSSDQPIDPNQYRPPTTNPQPGNIAITSFDVDQSGLLRGGAQMRFTLMGTPGGQASFTIPGVAQDIPMTESSPGVYTAVYNLPSNTPINVTKANAVARLRFGNNERMIQSGTSIGFDTMAPTISSVTPEPNSRAGRNRPAISAVFDDASGSGVDPNTVEVRMDGRNVTADAQVTSTFVSYRPDAPLAAGTHEVTITARDRAGNPVTKSWTFRIGATSDVIRTFAFDSDTTDMSPGSQVKFTMVGEPGGTASFTVGDRVVDRRMTEVTPGHYEGYYTVRRNDNFENAVVTGKLVTAGGETYTTESTTNLTTRLGTMEAPRFTDPASDARVNGDLVLRGTAAPGSRVHLKIDYAKVYLGAFRTNGTLAEMDVTADDRGNWQTDPISTDTGLGGGSITYTVMATTVGANGRSSTATKLTLKG